MTHRGRAPKERGLSPVQCPFAAHGPVTSSAARRVRAASSRAAPPPLPEAASAVVQSHMPRESQPIIGGGSWHVAPLPRAEEKSPPAGTVLLHSAWADYNQRGTARAPKKFACCASSRETVSSVVALVRAT